MGVPPGLQVHFYHFYGYEVYNRTRTHTRTCRARYGYRCKVMATGRERIFMYPLIPLSPNGRTCQSRCICTSL